MAISILAETYRGHMPALLSTQYVACPADFQVTHRHAETAAEFGKFSYGIQAFFSILCQYLIRIYRKVSVSDPVGTPYSAP